MTSDDLPDDMAEAFDTMKLAIMRHQADGWREVSADQTIQVLYYLMEVAMAK
jgi:hypothetical protein